MITRPTFIPWKPGMPRPCNDPACRTCDGDRTVLREYGEKRMRRWVNHERRKGLVR